MCGVCVCVGVGVGVGECVCVCVWGGGGIQATGRNQHNYHGYNRIHVISLVA